MVKKIIFLKLKFGQVNAKMHENSNYFFNQLFAKNNRLIEELAKMLEIIDYCDYD